MNFASNTPGQIEIEESPVIPVIPVYEDIILNENKESIEFSNNIAYGQINK